jgi:uncharacterized coiled-coil DUF342 family protein
MCIRDREQIDARIRSIHAERDAILAELNALAKGDTQNERVIARINQLREASAALAQEQDILAQSTGKLVEARGEENRQMQAMAGAEVC